MQKTTHFIPFSNSRHRIDVCNDQTSIIADGATNLLASLGKRTSRRPVLVGCKGGGCGKCRIKVTRGQYFSRKMSRAHISSRDEEQCIVLACRIFPRSDLTIIALD